MRFLSCALRCFGLLLWMAGLGAAIPAPRPAGNLPPGRFQFKSYGADLGLDNVSVTRLLQDPDGFLWVATQGHLFRYDGSGFTTYGKARGLPSANITSLLLGGNGRLWVGTRRGIAIQDGAGFRPLDSTSGLGSASILDMAMGPQGRIWVGAREGLFVETEPSHFKPVPGWPGGEAPVVRPGLEDSRIWVALGQKVYAWTAESGLSQTPVKGVQQPIEDLLALPQGRLLIRTRSQLLEYQPGPTPSTTDHSHRLPSTHPHLGRMYRETDGCIWIPTERGVVQWCGTTWSVYHEGHGLPTAAARAILIDREGSLWLGGHGLHRLLGAGQWFGYTTQEGLPHEGVWSMLRDSKGSLWVGTGLGLAQAMADRWQPHPAFQGRSIRSLAASQQGGLWVAGPPGEVAHLQTNGAVVWFRDGLPNARALQILEDPQGTVWLGTSGAGLFRKPRGSSLFQREPLPEAPAEDQISSLQEGTDGSLWVASLQGLYRKTPRGWSRYTIQQGLKDNSIRYMHRLKGGDLLLSYLEPLGMTRVRPKPDGIQVLEHVDAQGRLKGDRIYAMMEDSLNRIWVGTGRGLALLDRTHFQFFGRAEGMIGEDCNAQALLMEGQDRIWVGTSTGLACRIGPWSARTTEITTRFTAVLAQDLPVPVSPGDSLTLGHTQNDLVVRFAPMTFLHESRMEQEYRLLGRDSTWRPLAGREIHLPNLSPGSFELQVRSRLAGHGWGEPARLTFHIKAAWWQWRSLRLLGGISLLGLLGLGLRAHLKKLRRRNMELETLLHLADQLTRELEETNLVLQKESTTDPLTGLRNRRHLLSTIDKDIAHVERAYRTFQEQGLTGSPLNADIIFAIVDLDHFKQVNDAYGHLAGDAVLTQIADVLKAATRGSDTLVRWGGEEFLVVARHTQRKEGLILVERIRRYVAAHPFELPDGRIIHKTCSIGFAPYPFNQGQPLSWEQVVELADHCLYQAKTEGRNRWIGFNGMDAAEGIKIHRPPGEEAPATEGLTLARPMGQ